MVLVASVVGEFALVVQSEGFLLEGIGIEEWGSWKEVTFTVLVWR